VVHTDIKINSNACIQLRTLHTGGKQ